MMLADHGAEVIRIDRPGARIDARDPLLRSRRLIGVDLKSPEGKAKVRDLVKTADGLIEGNRIDGVSASGIYMSDEPAWPEGLQAARLVIRNNEIVNCGFDELFHTDPCQAQISIYSQNVKRKPVLDDPDFHHDILLEGNKIENWSKLGLYLSNVTNLTVKDTFFGEPREKPAALFFKGPLGVTDIEPFPSGVSDKR
jgi:hypothetical protein